MCVPLENRTQTCLVDDAGCKRIQGCNIAALRARVDIHLKAGPTSNGITANNTLEILINTGKDTEAPEQQRVGGGVRPARLND